MYVHLFEHVHVFEYVHVFEHIHVFEHVYVFEYIHEFEYVHARTAGSRPGRKKCGLSRATSFNDVKNPKVQQSPPRLHREMLNTASANAVGVVGGGVGPMLVAVRMQIS